MKPLLGGIEGGGTKFICAVGTDLNHICAEARFPTTTPDETINRAIDFFKEQEASLGKLSSIGFACFGPLDLNLASPTYGYILTTPKPHWSNANVVGVLRSAFDIPIGLDTDVNGAAFGEIRWGAAQGLDTFIYLTIGTGIGGGVFIDGKPVHGLLHPEMGHISLPHDFSRDPFEGICPFHKDCFEGLASGVAMEKRWGTGAALLASHHPAWELEAYYISHALANYIYAISPQRIIIGGGVGQREHLLKSVQQKTLAILNNCVQSPSILENINSYIVSPGLGNRSGIAGAIALAQQVLQDHELVSI